MSTSTSVREHVWTIADVYALQASGVFGERTQLMGGRLYDPVTPSPRHVATVERLRRWLDANLPDDLSVRQEAPVRVDDTSYPEPNLAIVRGSVDDYLDRHPDPVNVVAAIEVSLTTLDGDIAVKQPLYAAHGIRCVIVDVANRQFIDEGQPVGSVTIAGLNLDAAALLLS